MQKEFIFKQLKKEENKNDTFKTIRIRRKNKKDIKLDEIKEWLSNFAQDQELDIRDFAVSALGITNTFTLKWFGKQQFYNTDEYYDGKVDDIEKFDAYDYFDITQRIRNK